MKFFLKYYWLLVPVLCFLGIRFGLDFDGLYGQDSYEYHRFTDAIQNYLLTGEHPGIFFWPVNYPLVASLISFLTGTSWALQLVSFGSFIIILFLLKRILDSEYPNNRISGLYVLITTVLSPYFFRASLLQMSDMLATLFVLLAIVSWRKYNTTNKSQYVYVFATTAALAFFTRYVAILLLIPFGVHLLIHFWKEKAVKPFLISVVIFILACLPQFIFQNDSIQDYTYQLTILDWDIANFFQSRFSTNNGQLTHPFINLMYVFSPLLHPGYLLSGICLVFFMIRYHSKPLRLSLFQKLLWISVIAYLFFLGGIPTQNMRFFIPVFPLVVIVLFNGYKIAVEKLSQKLFVILFIGAALLQITYFSVSFSKLYARHQLEKSISNYILETSGDTPVYCFAVEGMLQTRGINRPIKSLYYEQFNDFETGSLVVFNLEQFEYQWKDENPMINWNRIQETHQVVEIQDFGQGWKIYRIE